MEKRRSQIDIEDAIEHNERTKDSKGVWSELSGDNTVKIGNVTDERIKRKLEVGLKEFFIDGKSTLWSESHSTIRTRSGEMISTRDMILFPKLVYIRLMQF